MNFLDIYIMNSIINKTRTKQSEILSLISKNLFLKIHINYNYLYYHNIMINIL